MELTSMVELITRNSLDAHLHDWAQRKRAGASWLDTIPVDAQGLEDLRQTRDRATRQGKRKEIHGRVAAELSLGFWRYLAESRYLTSLWVPSTHAAFPFGHTDLRTRQKGVALRMQQLNYVRNRAARREPIHQRDLGKDLGSPSTWPAGSRRPPRSGSPSRLHCHPSSQHRPPSAPNHAHNGVPEMIQQPAGQNSNAPLATSAE